MYLKSIRSGHYIPKSNIYIHYKPEIRFIDKPNRNICIYGHQKYKNVNATLSIIAKNLK